MSTIKRRERRRRANFTKSCRKFEQTLWYAISNLLIAICRTRHSTYKISEGDGETTYNETILYMVFEYFNVLCNVVEKIYLPYLNNTKCFTFRYENKLFLKFVLLSFLYTQPRSIFIQKFDVG